MKKGFLKKKKKIGESNGETRKMGFGITSCWKKSKEIVFDLSCVCVKEREREREREIEICKTFVKPSLIKSSVKKNSLLNQN